MIRIAVNEDHTLLREELCRILREKDDLKTDEASAVRPYQVSVLWPQVLTREKEITKNHSRARSLEISHASRLSTS